MNDVRLIGRLMRKGELVTNSNGTAIATVRVAPCRPGRLRRLEAATSSRARPGWPDVRGPTARPAGPQGATFLGDRQAVEDRSARGP